MSLNRRGVKFGTEEGPLLRAKFHPHRCNVLPLRGEKPQNRSLSKLNTGRFALRAMLPSLPVINEIAYNKLRMTVMTLRLFF